MRASGRTALVGIGLVIALVGLARAWTGPLLLVYVVTLDEHGGRIPAAGDDVEIWTRWGVLSTLTNDEGRAIFWRIPARAGLRPSLGPGDMPAGRKFGIFVTPPGCPRFIDRPVRSLGWLWRRIDITRPATATLGFEPSDNAIADERRGLTLTFPDSPGRRIARPIPSSGSFCVFAEPVDVVLREGSEFSAPAIHSWPTVVPEPNETLVLNVPARGSESGTDR